MVVGTTSLTCLMPNFSVPPHHGCSNTVPLQIKDFTVENLKWVVFFNFCSDMAPIPRDVRQDYFQQ